jgi:hypothetical protein
MLGSRELSAVALFDHSGDQGVRVDLFALNADFAAGEIDLGRIHTGYLLKCFFDGSLAMAAGHTGNVQFDVHGFLQIPYGG